MRKQIGTQICGTCKIALKSGVRTQCPTSTCRYYSP
jgi:hypothetical protein